MPSISCPVCENAVPASARVCPHCGSPLRPVGDTDADRTILRDGDDDIERLRAQARADEQAPAPRKTRPFGTVDATPTRADPNPFPPTGKALQRGSAPKPAVGPDGPRTPKPALAEAPVRSTGKQRAPPADEVTGPAAAKAAPGKLEPQLASSPKRDVLLGQTLGEYVVEERVGIGGMGIVYRARQPLIGKAVAIKVLRNDIIENPRDMERLLDEARAVNAIQHRNIISIFGAGETPDGRQYLVMEYLQGQTLEELLEREGRMSTNDAVPILEEVLSALTAAHKAGVVHRDLKPANVFLVKQADARPWVKLLDFGLARKTELREVSRIAGTPDYISPEHARGKPPGPPSDLYALGVMAFHLLTGRLPFEGTTPIAVMEQHVHKPPPDPCALNPAIPPAVGALVLRLLAKAPEDRPDAARLKAEFRAATKELRNASTMVGMEQVPERAAPRDADTAPALEPEGPASPTPLQLPPAPSMPTIDPRLARRALRADAPPLEKSVGPWPFVVLAISAVALAAAVYLLWGSPEAPVQSRDAVPIEKPANLPPPLVDPSDPPLPPDGTEVNAEPEVVPEDDLAVLPDSLSTWREKQRVALEVLRGRLEAQGKFGEGSALRRGWEEASRLTSGAYTQGELKRAEQQLGEVEKLLARSGTF